MRIWGRQAAIAARANPAPTSKISSFGPDCPPRSRWAIVGLLSSIWLPPWPQHSKNPLEVQFHDTTIPRRIRRMAVAAGRSPYCHCRKVKQVPGEITGIHVETYLVAPL